VTRANFKQTLDDLQKALERQALEILATDVADTVKVVEAKHVQTDVYDKYNPRVYERREYLGGLKDPDNLKVYKSKRANGWIGIEVVNETVSAIGNSKGKFISDIVEFGHDYGMEVLGYGYDFPNGIYGWEYTQPRPFIENTINELERTEIHAVAMKQGLQRLGYETK